MLKELWETNKKYVFLTWGIFTLAFLVTAIVEFKMLQKSNANIGTYTEQIKELDRKIGVLNYDLQTNAKARDKIIYIERTNYIQVTNLIAKYEKVSSNYASFGTNISSAVEYYRTNK